MTIHTLDDIRKRENEHENCASDCVECFPDFTIASDGISKRHILTFILFAVVATNSLWWLLSNTMTFNTFAAMLSAGVNAVAMITVPYLLLLSIKSLFHRSDDDDYSSYGGFQLGNKGITTRTASGRTLKAKLTKSTIRKLRCLRLEPVKEEDETEEEEERLTSSILASVWGSKPMQRCNSDGGNRFRVRMPMHTFTPSLGHRKLDRTSSSPLFQQDKQYGLERVLSSSRL